jgi:hypothetical protein
LQSKEGRHQEEREEEPTPASQEVAILVCEEGRCTERGKWHMSENY